jgi:release factor glutamine methyltransferase
MKTSFYDLPLLAAPGKVFTPRPSTERLVDEALERIDGVPIRVADVGTGSGAVAIALAVNRPQVEVWATDTSAAAVELARENARLHGVADRVHVLQGDLLEPIPHPVDLIVANLPYLPAEMHRPTPCMHRVTGSGRTAASSTRAVTASSRRAARS